MRHHTARINEASLRYTEPELKFYAPADDRSGDQPSTAKGYLETLYTHAASVYKTLTASRVPHEVARVVLPLSTYTQFVWQMDLHNLLHFLTLQCDKARNGKHTSMHRRSKNWCTLCVLWLWLHERQCPFWRGRTRVSAPRGIAYQGYVA